MDCQFFSLRKHAVFAYAHPVRKAGALWCNSDPDHPRIVLHNLRLTPTWYTIHVTERGLIGSGPIGILMYKYVLRRMHSVTTFCKDERRGVDTALKNLSPDTYVLQKQVESTKVQTLGGRYG